MDTAKNKPKSPHDGVLLQAGEAINKQRTTHQVVIEELNGNIKVSQGEWSDEEGSVLDYMIRKSFLTGVTL